MVEKRYAQALLAIAEQKGAILKFQEDMREIAAVYRDSRELRQFLANPEIGLQAKKSAVQAMLSGKVDRDLVSLMLLLLDKDRIGYLQEIASEFYRLASQRSNILEVTVLSAVPLEEEQVRRIKEKYGCEYGAAEVRAKLAVDPALLGGVKVMIGDRIIDGTVKGRLDALQEILAES